MKLKTSIFLWVTFATLLPLVFLVLVVTTYSETRYQEDVAKQVTRSLNTIVAEIKRRLYYEREIILDLSRLQSVENYKLVLDSINKGNINSRHFLASRRLSRFLASFQLAVPGFKTIRVIDKETNTLIMITDGKPVALKQDGYESSPFIEEDHSSTLIKNSLRILPKNEVSFLLLPQRKIDSKGLRGTPMLNAVVPLVLNKLHVGYMVVSFTGNQIDGVLNHAQRIHRGSLIIAELNPDNKERNGLVLYDDLQGISFSKQDSAPMRLQLMGGGRLWQAVHSKPDGDFYGPDKLYRTFYHDSSPYANRLVSWVVAIRIDLNEVSAPFNQIRWGIIYMAMIALLISLFIARVGARKISDPVILMSKSIKEYADGSKNIRVRSEGAEEIQQLENSFNYMANHADKTQQMLLRSAKLASLGQMAAGIGHEINNPLNNIMSLAKLILRTIPEGNERLRLDIESLREEGERATKIVKGILDFARQVPPRYSLIDITSWVEETLHLLQQAAKTKHINLVCEISQDISINGDRGQLQQVLVNIILNAIDVSKQDGDIIIRVLKEGEFLIIKVIDKGDGLPQEFSEKIFDPFFTTKDEGEGTGLGLSISHGIIEHHSGKLVLENNELLGVTATVTIPLNLPEVYQCR
ncbi:hypothetical protein MNBD_GAMMA12-503 [hydrothermal vent metagenome]|uniref:histidine kinase n=1 Tax=hydrothermal vent metagenome TaxID=652676 RepID=A0A3B0Y8A3_9ZZZZ